MLNHFLAFYLFFTTLLFSALSRLHNLPLARISREKERHSRGPLRAVSANRFAITRCPAFAGHHAEKEKRAFGRQACRGLAFFFCYAALLNAPTYSQ